MDKKVLLIIAHHGFQPQEYGDPKKILTAAGLTVVTASDAPGIATSKFGDQQPVDLTINRVKPGDYTGIFFIGGPGALEHLNKPIAHTIARAAAQSGRPWGAICIAPRILAAAEVLQGKRLTGWNNDGKLEAILREVGAVYLPEHCVVDGNLITADGPAAAQEFGEEILKKITAAK